MVQLLTPADFHSMPWKNGGGRTTEIAVHPVDATLDSFDWRVSIADVERDGSFSRFPGVDRTIALLGGAGMRLRSPVRDVELVTRYAPEELCGDDAIDCALVAGACRDFNAMFRRGRARGRVAVVRGATTDLDPASFRLVFAARGMHECLMPNRSTSHIGEGHALLVGMPDRADASAGMTLRPITDDAVALVVTIATQ